MSALEREANSGQISDVSLQISEQTPSAFAALASKHRVPGAQSAITNLGWEISQCHLSIRVLLRMS